MRYLLLTAFIFFAPFSASAAIVFDQVTHANTATNPSVSVTRGTGASSYIGIVIAIPASGTNITSCTWGASGGMTQIYSVADTLNGASNKAFAFYVLAPASGAQTVSCATTGSYQFEASTFSGVDQVNPLDANVDGASNKFKATNPAGVGNTSITGTTHIDNSRILGMLDWGAGTPSAGANTTCPVGTLDWCYGTANTTPAGSATLNISNGTSGNYSLTLFALQPVAVASSPMLYEF